MSHPITEFGTRIPEKLTISKGEHKVMIANTINSSEIIVEDNAKLTLASIVTEGWDQKQFLNFHLDGQNSQVDFIAIILATDEKTFEFETISNHQVPHTNAYYYVRGAMFDRSKVNYKGNLVIKKGAQITDSYLAHHSLMLSPDAKVETIPSLEIEADDVKAGHAATIGKIDDELSFYLQSRGIDKRTAQNMLIRGFIEADLDKIPDPAARETIIDQLENYLAKQLTA